MLRVLCPVLVPVCPISHRVLVVKSMSPNSTMEGSTLEIDKHH